MQEDNEKDTSKVGATQHRQIINTIELMVSCKFLPRTDVLRKPNSLAVLYIEKGSLLRAQRMSQFVREAELEDPTNPIKIWEEKARSDVIIGKGNPVFLKSFLFEAVNYQRLIVKVCIFDIGGD